MEDLTPLYNKEFYLAYLCGEDVVLPIPDGNAERYLAYLCGMDVTIPDVPDGRTETYLAYKCGEDVVLPDPMYRIEYYLAKWCGIDCEVPEPMYRIEYWLAQLANSGELKTVTGNPISVSDALAKPAESLTIEILPYQDLHGYANPWPAGCGKNLLPNISRNSSGYAVTVAFSDNAVILTGTANSSGGRNVFRSEYFSLKAGTYYFKRFSENTNGKSLPSVYIQDDTSIIPTDSDGKFTVSADTSKMNIGLNVASGNEYNYSCLFAVSADNIAAWSPYSNLCPFTGWTGVNIQRTGKNLLDDSGARLVTYNLKWSVTGSTGPGILLKKGKTYTVSCNSSASISGIYIHKKNTSQSVSIAYNATHLTYTPSEDMEVGFDFYWAGGRPDDATHIQLELGSPATAYEPYTGTTYSISWQDEAGTVYGGTLDVVSGVLTKAPYYDSYNGEPLVGPWVSSMDKYVPGATPTTGAQVVDLGGTGTDVQLSATVVQMLLGNNTIWNDVDGDMTLEYLADGPADDIDALQILLGNRYVNLGEPDEATDREALDILLGGNTR